MAAGARATDTRSHKAESENRVRRYDPAETRSRVLEAAYLLFGARGYANTGTADIAAQADVSEGSIFYHFGSKHALLVELGKLHGQKLIAAIQAGDAIEDISFEQILTRCFDFCEVNNVWETPGACVETALNKKINKQNPEAEPFYHAAKETVVVWTRSHLDALHEKRGIRGIPTEVTANLIFAAVGEAMHQYLVPGITEAEKARIRSEAIRFCDSAAGLSARPASEA